MANDREIKHPTSHVDDLDDGSSDSGSFEDKADQGDGQKDPTECSGSYRKGGSSPSQKKNRRDSH
jgi:hypothetical protein